ncbi:MAG: transglycosylase SLT domain-containing protein [Myxococcota bacterium]|jgi:soluble lytic murein transglycosylase-like protein|nr:transglycosylase SLT domain-containing protein [Myxococcota bacterium]
MRSEKANKQPSPVGTQLGVVWLAVLALSLVFFDASLNASAPHSEQSSSLFSPASDGGQHPRWAASAGEAFGSRAAQYLRLSRSRPSASDALRWAKAEVKKQRPQSAAFVLSAALRGSSVHDSELDTLAFLLLHLRLELAQPEEALSLSERFSAQHPLADYLDLARARALRSLARFDEALTHLAAIPEASPLRRDAALERVSVRLDQAFAAQDQQERVSVALNELKRFRQRYPDYPGTDDLLLREAQLFEAVGQAARATAIYEALDFERPWTRAAEEARERLAASGAQPAQRSFEDRYQRANTLRRMRIWNHAQSGFEALLRELEGSQSGGNGGKKQLRQQELENRVRYDLAQNFYQSSQYDAALGIVEALAELPSGQRDGVSSEQLRRMKIRCLAAAGRFDEARQVFEQGLGTGRNADLKRADFLEEHGRFAEAFALRAAALDDRAKKGWDWSLLAFLAGQYETALQGFEAMLGSASRGERAKIEYWSGRAAQEAGYSSRARRTFESLAREETNSYYGVLASSRLAEMKSAPLCNDSAGVCIQTQHARELAETRSRLRWHWRPALVSPLLDDEVGRSESRLGVELAPTAYGRHFDGALNRLNAAYGELFPTLGRAALLFELGWEHEARAEMRVLVLELRGLRLKSQGSRRPQATKPWALSFKRDCPLVDNSRSNKGAWGVDCEEALFPIPASLEGKRALAARQRALLDAYDALRSPLIEALAELGDAYYVRRFTQERSSEASVELYPRAFPEQITAAAREFDVEPYLLWTLMRIESAFNPDSISFADARGLLQVIPMTGRKIAEALGVDPFGADMLLDEQISIRFGAFYLAALLHKFNGQDFLAMAGYNGGPHNVARWLTQRGHSMPMDAFVETIPYPETKNYVKKGTGVAATYMQLHEGSHFLYVGNHIDTQFLPQPNF